MSSFDYIQTFKINPDQVSASPEVMLTSIDLFFKGKPATVNSSGNPKPGMAVWICEVINDQPAPERIIKNSTKVIGYDQINTSTNAQTPTSIGFTSPVIVKSGSFYGIVIKFDDPAFDIWVNRQGDNLVDINGPTNNSSSGSQSRFDGYLYKATNTNTYTQFSDRDLKFKVQIAQFQSNTTTVSLVNKDYEFFTIDNSSSGSFSGGEWVYQVSSNKSGTIALSATSLNIVGTGTTFTNHTVGDYIVVNDGSSHKDILQIARIIDNSNIELVRMPNFTTASISYSVPPCGRLYTSDYTTNRIILVDSTANSTVKFASGTRIIGIYSGASANVYTIDSYPIDNFKPTFLIGSPSSSQYNISFAASDSSNTLHTTPSNIELLKFNTSNNPQYILSRSVEVDTTASGTLFGTNRKSAVANVNINVNINSSKIFSVPYINSGQLDFYFYQNDINNTYTESRTVNYTTITDYDTETGKNGLARSKYFSKKISFATNRYAEDIIVYVQGYRPAGTQIKVYAKIHNVADKETFDDKVWTPLELKDNIDAYSSDDPNDIIEYTYGFPQYPEVQADLAGNFNTQSSTNNYLTTTTSQATVLGSGDLIKVYDINTPANHEVYVVSSANSTAVICTRNIDNTNLQNRQVGVQQLKYHNTAWNNIYNGNVVRYVSQSLVEFDTYTSMQVKIVLLSENTHSAPKVDQIQVIGVSA